MWILYVSDDGKIFVGSGIGDPFGPRCHKGRRMAGKCCSLLTARYYCRTPDCSTVTLKG